MITDEQFWQLDSDVWALRVAFTTFASRMSLAVAADTERELRELAENQLSLPPSDDAGFQQAMQRNGHALVRMAHELEKTMVLRASLVQQRDRPPPDGG